MEEKSPKVKKASEERRCFLLLRAELAREFGVENEWNKHYRDLLASKLDEEIIELKKKTGTAIGLPSETGMLNIVGQNPKYEENQSVPRADWLNLLSRVIGYENWIAFVEANQNLQDSHGNTQILPKIWIVLGFLGCLLGILALRFQGTRVIIGMGWTYFSTFMCLLGLVGYYFYHLKKYGKGKVIQMASEWIQLKISFFIGGMVLVVAFQIFALIAFRPLKISPANSFSFNPGEKIFMDWEKNGKQQRIAEFSNSESKIVWLPLGRNGFIIQFSGDDYIIGERISIAPGIKPINYEIH